MSRRKKTVDTEISDTTSEEKKLSLQEHLSEPMFLVSLAGLAVSVMMFAGFMVEYGPIMMCLLLLASLYFLNLHLKAKTRNTLLYAIPVFLAVATLFSYQITNSGYTRDYTIFTLVCGLFLFFYALASHNLMKLSTAFVLAIFLSTLVTHFLPALDIYLAEIDPHWHYKWAQLIVKDGKIPEYDYLTYPMKGGIKYYGKDVPGGMTFGLENYYNATSNTYPGGLNMGTQRFMAALFMGSTALVLAPLGFTVEDTAMLYPLVAGAFTLVAFYLLLRNMFADMRPYNEVCAALGTFMLFLSPVFATKAAAGNCEDDMLGMFFVVTTFLFFVLAFRRRSMVYTVAGGISMLLLALSWGGYAYVILVMGVSMGLYAVTSYLKNEYCVRLPPHALIMYAFGVLYPLVLHGQVGGIPIPSFTDYIQMTFFGSIALSIALEFLRVRSHGKIHPEDAGFFGKLQSLIEDNIKMLGYAAIIIFIAAILVSGPDKIIGKFIGSITGAKVDDVVGKTIAEQNPLAGDIGGFLNESYYRFGIAILYGICMIPILLYLAFDKNSFGASFVLAWSIPMMWGIFNKSQLLFTSSVPIASLGATIGLFAALNKKDLNGFRIVSVILILLVPLIYLPFAAGSMYSKFAGVRTLYVTMTQEMYSWRPALDYLTNNTAPTEAVITWWDYGHWITAISHRPVLIDNLQADPYEIQDVARFFMLKRGQEDAMDTIRAYNKRYNEMGMNLSHVAIDWTMIGKGSALHFIATGVIENKTEGSFMNYMTCTFLESQSSRQTITTDKNGKTAFARQLVFGCPWPIAGLIFEVVGEDITGVKAVIVDSAGNMYTVPWETWVKDNPASILGVQPLSDILMLAMQRPDILGNTAVSWKDQDGIIHSSETYQLIYVPGEFNDYMMTRLYLGDHVDDVPSPQCLLEENKDKVGCANYLNSGLFTGNISSFKPKYFNLAGDFSGGYVRVYNINYSASG
ncbi:MAG: STT3 domain-containing protein [Candidatus Altiarchaeota archaeon]|nr:STT3 domain-containing protein [Candidatus Altiarchaeota archaeon]